MKIGVELQPLITIDYKLRLLDLLLTLNKFGNLSLQVLRNVIVMKTHFVDRLKSITGNIEFLINTKLKTML